MTKRQNIFLDIVVGLFAGVAMYYEFYIYIFILALGSAALFYFISRLNVFHEFGRKMDNSGKKKKVFVEFSFNKDGNYKC